MGRTESGETKTVALHKAKLTPVVDRVAAVLPKVVAEQITGNVWWICEKWVMRATGLKTVFKTKDKGAAGSKFAIAVLVPLDSLAAIADKMGGEVVGVGGRSCYSCDYTAN